MSLSKTLNLLLSTGSTQGNIQALKYLKIGTCPASQKLFAYMEKNVNLHWKSSKVSLARQPEALINTSGRVDFWRPDMLEIILTGT